MKIKQKKTFIVCGASGGIGAVIVDHLYKAGYNVVLFSRTEETLKKVSSQYSDQERLCIVTGDATNQSDIENVFDMGMAKFGTVDGIINATGSWKRLGAEASVSEALAVTRDALEKHVIAVTVIAFTAKEFFLGEKKAGLVINISSHAGYRPELAGNLAYGPAKAAARLFMRSLDIALRNKKKICFCDIAPAIVNTPDLADILDTPRKRALAVQPKAIAAWIVKNVENPHIPAIKNFSSKIEIK